MATTQIKDGFAGGSDNQLKVNSDGSINSTLTGSGISNPSVGPTGSTAPTQATEIAGVAPSGNLVPLSVSNAGVANVSVTNFPATQVVSGSVVVTQATGTNLHAVIDSGNVTATISGTPNVAVTSSVLPTGAATSALQTTGNGYLQTLATNLPPQGQALASASTPVVLPQAQITALTPPTSVSVNNFPSSQNVVVTSSALPTGAATQAGLTTINTTLGSPFQAGGSIGNTAFALNAGSANIGSLTNITGTISLPTGAATSALQTTGNTSLSTIATNTTGVATAANQTTMQTTLSSIQTNQTSGGQKTTLLGATTGGTAETPIGSDVTGAMLVKDALITGAQYRAQSVTTTAALALGGASALTNRKMVMITPTNGTIYLGFDSTVTTSSGTPIVSGQTFTLAATTSITPYVIAAQTTDVRIAEVG